MPPTTHQEDGMKKFRISFMTILCMLFSISPAQNLFCQDGSSLEVMDAAICLNVENRACVDPKEEFSTANETLYCFTRVTGAKGDIEVAHVWYYGDVERARISLSVRSSRWRTFSSKRIQAHETGKWRVEVLGPGNTLLKTIPFTVVQ
jgi:hypothetical protein